MAGTGMKRKTNMPTKRAETTKHNLPLLENKTGRSFLNWTTQEIKRRLH
jgi:hypothetical protein